MLTRQSLFEFDGFQGTEVVSATDDIAAVGVASWVERVQERKHFSSVATTTKNNEEARRLPLWARTWFGRIECWKDVEYAKLKRSNKQSAASEFYLA